MFSHSIESASGCPEGTGFDGASSPIQAPLLPRLNSAERSGELPASPAPIASPLEMSQAIIDLFVKAERQGRFSLPRSEVIDELRTEVNSDESKITKVVDSLVTAGTLFCTATEFEAVLYRDPKDLSRARDGLNWIIRRASKEGHAALPPAMAIAKAQRLLLCEQNIASDALYTLVADGGMLLEKVGTQTLLYSAAIQSAEVVLVNEAGELAQPSCVRPPRERRVRKIVGLAAKASRMTLNEAQRKAVAAVVQHPVTLITGAPGTGKTTVIRAAADALARVSGGGPILLAAPTGKAARRLSDATSRSARTIHRLLRYSLEAGGFTHDKDNPLSAAAVIIDEASMIGLELMASLLAAIPRGCRVVLVGDPGQLPPIACGQPFADMLTSGRFPTCRLTAVLRQSAGGAIAAACHAIREGRLPSFAKSPELTFIGAKGNDFRHIVGQTVAEAMNANYDPFNDIQVLTPIRNMTCGVHAMNVHLAPICNLVAGLNSQSCRLSGGVGRIGDKIQQIRNNTEKGVFNGDQGRIAGFFAGSPEETGILTIFDTRAIFYTEAEAANELALAYAITIHRSQGSEWPVVVLCLPPGAGQMLSRNLLYTAISRGKKRVIVVGNKVMVEDAVRTAGNRRFGGVIGRFHMQGDFSGG